MSAPKNKSAPNKSAQAVKLKNRTERGKVIAVIGGAALLIGASFGVQAIAESTPVQHAKLFFSATDGEYKMFSHAKWGEHRGHGFGHFETMSEAEIEKKMSRLVKHVAIEIDATPEQTTKITRLIVAVAKDIQPLRSTFKASGRELHELLMAPTINREAIEKIRLQRLADADNASKELMTALTDVAEVLTPEQRQTLDERIEQFRSMRHRWRRG